MKIVMFLMLEMIKKLRFMIKIIVIQTLNTVSVHGREVISEHLVANTRKMDPRYLF